MTAATPATDRVRVDGKFFRLGAQKFYVKGVTYGPFAPNPEGEMFPPPEQTRRDLIQLQQLGANVIRIYYVPPRWFLDLIHERGLKVLVDIPWAKHLCFLDSVASQAEARRVVREAVTTCKDHPALFAFSVVNEISAEIVRWSGVERVQTFINELIDEGRGLDPHCLFTFTSYPPTEFLQVDNVDFVCFNVYLHHPKPFTGYLARLQTLADAKPLILGEFGMDSIREGEPHKCEFLAWQIELAFRAGLAGTVVFSYTDDWWRGGMQITEWGFGLTTRERQPKNSFHVVQRGYRIAPHFPLPRVPKVSVVVATYNGSRTLPNCLESLKQLNYPDYEVILVDDGTRDRTPEVAKEYPFIRYLRQTNQGLSAARNAGIGAATGEIVAFTDDDCRVDEDWLYYLVSDLLRGGFAGIGGHNLLPPEDSNIAAAVVVSPGGPAHVMLTDHEAEHVPGCNMAFYKWALERIGMFDPVFRRAGDDVDVCWRLQDNQLKLGFSASGFVWHFRRSTVKAYLKQQAGYGEAEALLLMKHPEHYNSFGGGIWHGRIYAPSYSGLLLRGPVIYHGIFGSGFFQRLYAPDPVQPLMLCTSLAFHVCINLPLLLLAPYFDVLVPVVTATLGVSLGTCVIAATQANLPRHRKRFWSRPLVALLFFLQPVVRGWARFRWRLNLLSSQKQISIKPTVSTDAPERPGIVVYWSPGNTSRYLFVSAILSKLEREGWSFKTDTGWTTYDAEIPVDFWTRLQLTTVSEELEHGKMNFRCRIESFWTLPAKLFAAITFVVGLGLVALFAEPMPWVWLTLTALPLVCWMIEDDCQTQERALATVIDAAAESQLLTRLDHF